MKVFDGFAGAAYGDAVRRYVAGYDRSGADDGSFADGHAWHNDASYADMGTVFDGDGSVFQGQVHDWFSYFVLTDVTLVA